ncbi:CLUMA_CG014628, isoform A [Clunio marinus]|uniref:CLUMA_CG014628, isoform A n=1 Tax=Clunio marinus TaxID=568069 RepID=A0A1J1INC8_9DIPT|nr:CLUMA_CG014628, isoform A [Clunio marinus]
MLFDVKLKENGKILQQLQANIANGKEIKGASKNQIASIAFLSSVHTAFVQENCGKIGFLVWNLGSPQHV